MSYYLIRKYMTCPACSDMAQMSPPIIPKAQEYINSLSTINYNQNIYHIMVILTPKMVEHIIGIIFILTAVKNYTSNFADSPFGPDYCSFSNASFTAPSNQHYYSMYFQNISNNCRFFRFDFNQDRLCLNHFISSQLTSLSMLQLVCNKELGL